MTNTFLKSGLFGALMQDEEVAYVFSAENVLAQMLAFERGWTIALRNTGQIDNSSAEAALRAIDGYEMDLPALAEAANRDGVPVPALVAALRSEAVEDGARAIHTGATSQDVIDTAMVTVLSDALDLLCRRVDVLNRKLDALSDRFGSQQMVGRTRMQAARPITVSARITAWRQPLTGLVSEVPQLRAGLRRVQYGGAVGTRDGVTGQGGELARILGRELDLDGDKPCWHTDRTLMVDYGNWLLKVSGICGKFGLDLALMAQQGVDEVELSGTGGSSAMAHKRNPIRAEVLTALARYVAALQGLLGQSLIHEQERSGSAWAQEWMSLPSMTEATGASLNAAINLADQVVVLGHRDDRGRSQS